MRDRGCGFDGQGVEEAVRVILGEVADKSPLSEEETLQFEDK